MIDRWVFYMGILQQIKELGYEDTYKQYGQTLLDRITSACEENFELVRWPEDVEVLEAINNISRK